MTTTAQLKVVGPYPSGDPRKPYAVGATSASGAMSYQFTTGSPERAQAWADGLRNGTLNPREMDR